jgi:hypothetical protein
MKADAKTFKGIEYIVVTDLPQLQQQRLLDTINHDLFIKIMIDGKIVSRCLQYKDYVHWYEQSAKAAIPVAAVEMKTTERVEIKPALALNKI